MAQGLDTGARAVQDWGAVAQGFGEKGSGLPLRKVGPFFIRLLPLCTTA